MNCRRLHAAEADREAILYRVFPGRELAESFSGRCASACEIFFYFVSYFSLTSVDEMLRCYKVPTVPRL